MRLTFTGHDTFSCRNFWLKKGLDHIWSEGKFNRDAVTNLGVGNNMVSSIRFWLKSFGMIDENGVAKQIAEDLFKDSGYDPFIEDIGTIWLLHYQLVTSEVSSIYSLIFNEFRKKRIEFTREHLLSFIINKCVVEGASYNESSVKKDIGVFLSNYCKPERSKSIEDDFSGLLYELELVTKLDKYGKSQWYSIENNSRTELPALILFYCLIDKYGNSTVSFNELLNDPNSVGSVFALSSNGLMNKLEQILDIFPQSIIYTDDGGIRVLQFKETISKESVLRKYYD